MRRAKLHVSPSLAIAKAKGIASTLSTFDSVFYVSWQWFNSFRTSRAVKKNASSWRSVEINKYELGLLPALEKLSLNITLRMSTTWTILDLFFCTGSHIFYSYVERVHYKHQSQKEIKRLCFFYSLRQHIWNS